MRRASFLLLLMLCSWSVLGFGCKPRDQVSGTGPGGATFALPETPRIPEPVYVPKGKGDQGPEKEVVELRQVLANLERAKSYRSRIRTPLSNGNLMAELLFSRSRGLHGILQAGGVNSELLMENNSVFVRYGTSTWQDVSGSEEAQTARTQLSESLLVNENGTSRVLLRDSARVTSIKDDPEGCKLYTIEQSFFQPQVFTQTLELCVKNTYPVRIKSTTPQGTIEITYDRFDDEGVLAVSPRLK